MRLTGLTTKVLVELCSFLETLGRIPVLAFPSFSSLPTFFGSWPLSRSSRPMAQHLQISLPGPCSRDTSSLPPSSKDPYDHIGPQRTIPPTSRSLPLSHLPSPFATGGDILTGYGNEGGDDFGASFRLPHPPGFSRASFLLFPLSLGISLSGCTCTDSTNV